MPMFTMHCTRCGMRVAARARRIGPLEISVLEHHLLTCRPLDTTDGVDDLLRRYRITVIGDVSGGNAPAIVSA